MSENKENSLSQFLIEQSKDPEFIKQHEEEWKNYKFKIPDHVIRSLESYQKAFDSTNWKYIKMFDNLNLYSTQQRIGTLGYSFYGVDKQYLEIFDNPLLFNNDSLIGLSKSLRDIHESLTTLTDISESVGVISAKVPLLEIHEQISDFWSAITPSIIAFQDILSTNSEIDQSLNPDVEDFEFDPINLEALTAEIEGLSEVEVVNESDVTKLKCVWEKIWKYAEKIIIFYNIIEILLPCPVQHELEELRNQNMELIEVMEHQHNQILESIENIQLEDSDTEASPSREEDSKDSSNLESYYLSL